MADYHIYLHGVSTNEDGNKTAPFSAKSNSDSAFVSKTTKAINEVNSTISNGINVGASSLTKVIPDIAVGIALYRLTDHILSTGFNHLEEYTGNYKYNTQYNNFKAIISNIMNPIGYTFKTIHKQFQIEKHNKEISQQRRLLGNSVLKDFNIGV